LKVAIIDDSPEIIEAVFLCFEMRWPGATLSSSRQGNEGLELVKTECPDIVILDIGLPGIDGFEVLRRIRDFSDVPVIILSVRNDEMDKLKGLELGADDYIVKPFAPAELLARVKAVLRRSQMPELRSDEKPVVSGTLMINPATKEVTHDGQIIRLTPTEYNLLSYLVKNGGRVLTHHTLLERVWGPECAEDTCYLRKYVQRLREKLGDNGENPKMILSERGLGYRFVSNG